MKQNNDSICTKLTNLKIIIVIYVESLNSQQKRKHTKNEQMVLLLGEEDMLQQSKQW